MKKKLPHTAFRKISSFILQILRKISLLTQKEILVTRNIISLSTVSVTTLQMRYVTMSTISHLQTAISLLGDHRSPMSPTIRPIRVCRQSQASQAHPSLFLSPLGSIVRSNLLSRLLHPKTDKNGSVKSSFPMISHNLGSVS